MNIKSLSLLLAQKTRGASCKMAIPLILASGLAGCANSNLQDLQQYVQEVKNSQKGRIEPLPEFKPFETFTYNALSLKDPFVPWQTADAVKRSGQQLAGTGPQPDFNRRKEILEQFPLDSLRMVGTLERDGRLWAIIKAPDGLVHRVREDNYMGQNHGKIIRLAEGKIEITEIMSDGLGGWMERPTSVTLVE